MAKATATQKLQSLDKAIKIAEAAASGGGQGSASEVVLALIIKATYEQMVEIIETIE